jgi:hypothetical protein
MPGPATTPLGNLRNLFMLSVPISTASVGANTTVERTFTVIGLDTGFDFVAVNKPTHQAGLGIVNVRVSADDTLAITYMNNTGAGITPTTESYLLMAWRHDYPDRNNVPVAIA